MEQEHSPMERRPARTVFRLTSEEVIVALVRFVESKGKGVPQGKRFIWLKDRNSHYKDSTLVTLGVDHVLPDATPAPADEE